MTDTARLARALNGAVARRTGDGELRVHRQTLTAAAGAAELVNLVQTGLPGSARIITIADGRLHLLYGVSHYGGDIYGA